MSAWLLRPGLEKTDNDLVGQLRSGDLEAFRIVVERYQNLLCSLAYSICGDVGKSEDLAQETFVTAWRKIGDLQEPEKLKAWLCGILRHLGRNYSRARRRDPLSEPATLEDGGGLACLGSPSEDVMSREERDLLWKVLEEIPETYREPLILYYRTGESTIEVAQALDLTEEAVRQRLARGRALLGERVARLVESGLRGSAPGKAFAVCVLGALPGTSASAGLAASASGQPAVASTGIGASGLSFLLKWAGGAASVLSVGAGWLALWGTVRNTRNARERRFVTYSTAVLVVLAAGAFTGLVLLPETLLRGAGEWTKATAISLGILAGSAFLDCYVIWMAVRQKALRGSWSEPTNGVRRALPKSYHLTLYGTMTALSFGTLGWLMLRASAASDLITLVVLLISAAGATTIASRSAIQDPRNLARVLIYLLWFVAAVNIFTIHFRWDAWLDSESNRMSSGPIIVIVATLFAAVRTGWFLKQRFLKTTTPLRDFLISASAFAVVMILGVLVFRAVKTREVSQIQVIQFLVADVQPDGSIKFQLQNGQVNLSEQDLAELKFISSGSKPITSLMDGNGRLLNMNVSRKGDTFFYSAHLHEPVKPGEYALTRSTGEEPGFFRPTSNRGLERFHEHWPANGLPTLRAELYRLPTGMELASSTLPATTGVMKDGRTKVLFLELIPPGGKIQYHMGIQRRLDN